MAALPVTEKEGKSRTMAMMAFNTKALGKSPMNFIIGTIGLIAKAALLVDTCKRSWVTKKADHSLCKNV